MGPEATDGAWRPSILSPIELRASRPWALLMRVLMCRSEKETNGSAVVPPGCSAVGDLQQCGAVLSSRYSFRRLLPELKRRKSSLRSSRRKRVVTCRDALVDSGCSIASLTAPSWRESRSSGVGSEKVRTKVPRNERGGSDDLFTGSTVPHASPFTEHHGSCMLKDAGPADDTPANAFVKSAESGGSGSHRR